MRRRERFGRHASTASHEASAGSRSHELAHAILGGGGSMDNRTDAQSYEYFTHNRPSQFYGELHWAGAWPLLVERVGPRTPERPRAGC